MTSTAWSFSEAKVYQSMNTVFVGQCHLSNVGKEGMRLKQVGCLNRMEECSCDVTVGFVPDNVLDNVLGLGPAQY